MRKGYLCVCLLVVSLLVGCGGNSGTKDDAQKEKEQVESTLEDTLSELTGKEQDEAEFPEQEAGSESDVKEPETESESEVKEPETEAPEEIITENADEEKLVDKVTLHTLWLKEMSAEEAKLNSILGHKYEEDTPAMALGVMFEAEEGADNSTFTYSYNWYSLQDGEYVEVDEITSFSSVGGHINERALFVARFPKGKVDVNNLYFGFTNFSGTKHQYFKVNPDEFYDIYSIEVEEEMVPDVGKVVYIMDIPFIFSEVTWNSDISWFSYNLDKYTYKERGIEYGDVDLNRTMVLLPLTGQTSFDFSFYRELDLSDNYDSEEYSIYYVSTWEDQKNVNTIEGNGIQLNFRGDWYYEEAEYDAYKAEHGEYKMSQFYDEIYDRRDASDFYESYLELKNTKYPNTKLYMFKKPE